MKKLLIIAVSLLSLSACKKKDKNEQISSDAPNIITLNIDGKSYSAKGAGYLYINQNSLKLPQVQGTITKLSNQSYIDIGSAPTSGNTVDFSLDLSGKNGPTTGIGNYEIGTSSGFTENFTGGQAYDIKSGTITVTTADADLIEGTLSFEAINSTGSKTVTGSFKITQVGS